MDTPLPLGRAALPSRLVPMQVALYLVARRAGAGDDDAGVPVAGDQVAAREPAALSVGQRPADLVPGGAHGNFHAVVVVGERGGAVPVGADEVAGHLVVRGAVIADQDAANGVAGDEVARSGTFVPPIKFSDAPEPMETPTRLGRGAVPSWLVPM